MRIVHPDKWLPCDGISLEEAADTAVRCSDRHVLVIAGPGAGKTELLAQKAAFLFQTNQCNNGLYEIISSNGIFQPKLPFSAKMFDINIIRLSIDCIFSYAT